MKKVKKERIKIHIIENSNMFWFVDSLTKLFFKVKGLPNGSSSAAVSYCVKYALARDEDGALLGGVWNDLPPLRMRQIDKTAHELKSKGITVYMDKESLDKLDYFTKVQSKRLNKLGKYVDDYKYPKFRGLRRNVVLTCIDVLKQDICEYCMYGLKLNSLKDLEDFYKIEIEED